MGVGRIPPTKRLSSKAESSLKTKFHLWAGTGVLPRGPAAAYPVDFQLA